MNIKSIKQELKAHAQEVAKNYGKEVGEWTAEDLHHAAFNEDYYIIGYHMANAWLEEHGVNAFEGLSFVKEWEKRNFGEVCVSQYNINIIKQQLDSESLVNMMAYIIGEEVVSDVMENL